MSLSALNVSRLTGSEPFNAAGAALEFDLLSFWQWACSEICGNTLRGVLAEYLVARAVGASDGVRTEWDPFDVLAPNGLKVEVKSSGYLQSWKQEKLSPISFDIAPKRSWDPATNTMADTTARSADVYVFALHEHQDKATIDPLNVAQWFFYVLPTAVLNEQCPTQKTIALSSLLRLKPKKVTFAELAKALSEEAPKVVELES